jgi:hypothetical protein
MMNFGLQNASGRAAGELIDRPRRRRYPLSRLF